MARACGAGAGDRRRIARDAANWRLGFHDAGSAEKEHGLRSHPARRPRCGIASLLGDSCRTIPRRAADVIPAHFLDDFELVRRAAPPLDRLNLRYASADRPDTEEAHPSVKLHHLFH